MEENLLKHELPEHLVNLIEEGAEISKIEKALIENGMDTFRVNELITTIRTNRLIKRRKRGFTLGVIGSILLVTGFILTVLFYHSGISIHVVMYGLTSVGVVFLLIGMIDILGW